MKKYFTIIVLLITGTSVFAQNNIVSSKVSFEIKNLGIKTGGTIGGVTAIINFDPANLSASKIEATAEVNTIDTDNSLRDSHLKGEDYFNAEKYPMIVMSSTTFKQKGGNNYMGSFNITIKGITKSVDLPFTYADTGNANSFKGSFKINRRDFGIGGNSLTLSDEVIVNVEVKASK
ncbi:YceI family protein [Mucilaginibacter segetis]|uniref:YceI family protein n=1 Tax=Mucilaginibacter segetis TaxID=2793071 RepID=A0A934UPJ8_9SPHI|nr:YceI family protein [Mucilaginibacter segetis]MBK0381190.1 YceI family protein [Mucilaginibacter segetis]